MRFWKERWWREWRAHSGAFAISAGWSARTAGKSFVKTNVPGYFGFSSPPIREFPGQRKHFGSYGGSFSVATTSFCPVDNIPVVNVDCE